MAALSGKRFYLLSSLPAVLILLNTHILPALEIPIKTTETEGFSRRGEPVSFGVPMPRGVVTDPGILCITDRNGMSVPAQFETSSTYPDGSTKWLLVDFSVWCKPNSTARYTLSNRNLEPDSLLPLKISETGQRIEIETGVMRCVLEKEYFNFFGTVYLDHDRDGTLAESERVTAGENVPGITALDALGRKLAGCWGPVKSMEIETRGPVRATVAVKGLLYEFDTYRRGEGLIHYTARLHFYAGSGLVRVFFTLENPEPTLPLKDEDGDRSNWVMGRKGSFFFDDMSLQTRLAFDGPIQMSVGDDAEEVLDRVVLTDRGGVYQESSGGENWFLRNHMNHVHKIPLTFRGAKFFLDGTEPYRRNRPNAWLHLCDRRFGLAVAVRHFWQNFPKALSAGSDGTVRVALWPEEFPDHHEIQGGEIKTHEFCFFFHTGPQGSTPGENRIATMMGAFHFPLVARAPASWYMDSGFFDDAVPYNPRKFPAYERLLHSAVCEEGNNLFTDREAIDEYGWRHYGDTWARNEINKTGGPHTGRLMVSHFNHEYDHGYGMLFQHLRTIDGSPEISSKWWHMAETGLRHQSDIDYYHALDDPFREGIHNGGKFTHSAHGAENALAGHRGSPRLTWFGSLRWPWGQSMNPESGHFDNRGLMAYYYLTGDRRVLETAMDQANLVLYKITENKFAQIGDLNRNSGHNLQILTDAYLYTWDEKYRKAAGKIIESTHPDKQWYMTADGRKNNPDKKISGFWSPAICIKSVARFTGVMEEKTGRPYKPGREYVTRYADFVATFLAAGPETGFHFVWSPASGGTGRGHGQWTYRIADLVMYGHKFTIEPALKKRCIRAARDAFACMAGKYKGAKSFYLNSKANTMHTGGGHEYTRFVTKGWTQ